MGDNINIDFSPLANANPINAFMKGYAGAQQLKLMRTADEARANALANPNDPNALAKLAVYDPASFEGLAAANDRQRAQTARTAAADFVRARTAPTSYAQPVAAPQPDINQPGALPPMQQGQNFDQAFAPVKDPAAFISPQAPHMVEIGAAVSQGANPNEAFAKLVQADPAMAQNIVQTIGTMDEQRRTKLAETSGALGTVAQQLLSAPQAQRAQLLKQAAPYLSQHGVTPDQINQAIQSGLSDQFLQGFIGQAVGVTGMIEQANKQREFGQTDQQIALRSAELAQTTKYQNWQMSQPKEVGMSSVLVDPRTGKVVYDPMGAGGVEGQYTGGWTPRARNGGDNPDNVVDDKIAGAAKFLGVGAGDDISKLDPMRVAKAMTLSEGGAGSLADRNNNPANIRNPDGSFKKFPTKEAGLQAAAELVKRKIQNGQTTVQSLVEGLPKGGAGGAIESQAQAIARGDAAPLNGRAAVTGIGARVMGRVYEINPEYDAKNYNPQIAVVKSFTSGKDSQTVQALNNVAQHIHTLDILGSELRNGNVQMVNRIAQGWAAATGQPAPTNFDAAKQIIGGEIVKAIAGAGGGQGDREEAARILSRVNSPQQLHGALVTIRDLVGSQLKTLRNKYEAGTGSKDFDKFLTPDVKALFGASAGGVPDDIRAIMAKYGVR